jgi:outer membrane protein W
MRTSALALIGASLLAAAPAMAIDQAEKWELQLLGAGSNDVDFTAGGFSLNAQLAYYFNDQVAVTARQTASYTDTGSDDVWSAGTRLGAQYHFNYEPEQEWVPYVGVNAGYLYGDIADTWIAGPEAGIRYFVNDTTFIGLSVAYEFLFDDADDADSSFDDGQFIYGLGIGFQW